MSKSDLQGKIVLVTGSTRGVGFSLAQAFYESGAMVVVNGRSESSVKTAIERLGRERKGELVGIVCDISNVIETEQMFSEIRKKFGALDILINNAALRPRKKFSEIDEGDWDTVFATNVKAPFFLAKSAFPLMRDRSASILNISSIAAIQPPSYYQGLHYIASKGGLVSLSRGLAIEFRPYGIRVNAIVPGVIQTEELRPEAVQFAQEESSLQRPLTVQEIVDLCLFLSSKAASGINGITIPIGW